MAERPYVRHSDFPGNCHLLGDISWVYLPYGLHKHPLNTYLQSATHPCKSVQVSRMQARSRGTHWQARARFTARGRKAPGNHGALPTQRFYVTTSDGARLAKEPALCKTPTVPTNSQLRTGEVLIIVVVLFMWAGESGLQALLHLTSGKWRTLTRPLLSQK